MDDMINITIKLFAHYRVNNFKAEKRSYAKGTTARDVIADTGIDIKQFPLGILMANGRHINEDYILKEGDILAIFPKVGGG